MAKTSAAIQPRLSIAYPKLLVVQLSDIHIDHKQTNPILERGEYIVRALRSVERGEEKTCVILVNGDIAQAGHPKDYELAIEFFNDLREKILKENIASDVTYLFIPGNHDCNYDHELGARGILRQDVLRSGKADESVISICASVQKDYFAFRATILGTDNHEPHLYESATISVGEKTARFHLFNTAWLCQRGSDQGRLSLPVQHLQIDESPSDIALTVLHHPLHWLEAENKRLVERRLEPLSDILLTGHEHEQDGYIKQRRTGQKVEIIEAGVLQETHDRQKSAFNVLIFDLHDRAYKRSEFNWQGILYQPLAELTNWAPLPRTSAVSRREYEFEDVYWSFLEAMDARFTHPYKAELHLSDVFVWLDLIDLPSIEKLDSENVIGTQMVLRADKVASTILNRLRWCIVGNYKSGKTTLAKRFLYELDRNGIVPLIVDAAEFRSHAPNEIQKVINKTFEQTYKKPEPVEFHQLETSRRAIIIDDFHKLRLKDRERQQLLRNLEGLFGRIYLFTAEHPASQQILEAPKTQFDFMEAYAFSLIDEFGYSGRAQIVEKWVSAGRSLDQAELLHQVRHTTGIIDTVLRTKLVPSSPFLVLGLLQQLETYTSTTAGVGSYSHLFEILIKSSLAKTGLEKVPYDTKLNFLSELAYWMRTTGHRALTDSEMKDFYQVYEDKYEGGISFDAIIRDSEESGLLTFRGGGATFRYPYLYHYFVATYIHDKLRDDESVQRLVKELSQTLHLDESSRVMIFLSHLSKDSLVIGGVLEAAQSLFKDVEPCDLDSHVDALNGKYHHGLAATYSPSNPADNRKRLLEHQDELERQKKMMGDGGEDLTDTEDGSLDELGLLNLSFKTIDLLGQIIRSFSGSLTAEIKQNLMREAFQLGLRNIRFLLDSFSEAESQLIEYLTERRKSRLPKKEITPQEEDRIKEMAKTMVFFLSKISAYVFLKRIAGAMGTERLTPTLEHLVKSNSTPAYRLLEIAIRLDHQQDFPEIVIRKLYEDLKSKPFPLELLRNFVLEHFNLFERPKALIQSVCASLEISEKKATRAAARNKNRNRPVASGKLGDA